MCENGVMTTPLPCPFCGSKPKVLPERPEYEGDAWAEVQCCDPKCWAQVSVSDGCNCNAPIGSDAYKAIAIARWNKRIGVDNEEGDI